MTSKDSGDQALIEAQKAQEAREAAERQFIGDILEDENSDYGVEEPEAKEKMASDNANAIVKSNTSSLVMVENENQPQNSPKNALET